MKRLWLAVAILIALFAATMANSFYLSHITTQLTDRLTQAEEQAREQNWAETEKLTEEALEDWRGHDGYLHTVLRHQDTNQISSSFAELQEYIRCRSEENYFANNARLMGYIRLLSEMEQFRLKNLL